MIEFCVHFRLLKWDALWSASDPAKTHERYADCDQQDPDPSPARYALMQEGRTAERAGRIAERRYRHDKAYIVHGEGAEQREEGKRHHAYACPHPRLAERSQDDPGDLGGMKASRLANVLHRARHA
jgi:hypothetical protein